MLYSRLITDFGEFLTLRNDWNRLLERQRSPSVWMCHEWFDCWWRAFGGAAQLFVVALYDDDVLAAVAPMMITRMKIKGTHQRVLRFIENGITPRSQFITGDNEEKSLGALWRELLSQKRHWDLAILSNVCREDDYCAILREALDYVGSRSVEGEARLSPFIDLTPGWEVCRKSFGKWLQRNLKRARSRLSALGSLELVVCRESQELLNGFELCCEISRRSWKGSRGIDLAGQLSRARFFELLTETAISHDWMRIYLLRCGERYLAFEYILSFYGHALPLAADYDLEFKQHSPGSVLRALILEQLTEEGVREYDFDGTIYNYKMQWTRDIRSHSQFWVFHDGFKSRLLYAIKRYVFP